MCIFMDSKKYSKIQYGMWKIFDCNEHKAKQMQGGPTTCFGINDATIYGFPIFFTEEFLKTRNKSVLKPAFQLAKNEAIVLMGKTPGPCIYWGITPYLHKRKYENESEYTKVNASLGDTLNFKTFEKTHGLEPGQSFNKPFILIIGQNPTINKFLYDKNTFMNKDVSTFYKQIMPLPGDILKDDDYFMILSRVTYMKPEIVNKYKEKPGIFCFKVTVDLPTLFLGSPYKYHEPSNITESNLSPDPSNFFQISRNKNIDEKNLVVGAKSIEETMKNYIKLAVKEGRKNVPVKVYSVSLDDPEFPINSGLTCIQKRYDCYYDNRDTVYTVTLPINTVDAPNGISVFGVNHVNTGKALYTNINIYDGDEYTPIFDLLIEREEQPQYIKNNILVKNYKYYYELFIPVDFYRTHRRIFIAERAYLQGLVSSSFDTLVFPSVFVMPYSQKNLNRYKCKN